MTADEYLRRVEYWLRDLPWGMRRELLAELRGHLDELPQDTDLAERLGAPEEYAKEMRAAAGLERRRGAIAFLRARRPRNVVLTVIVLTLVGLAIGAAVWVQSYQPIVFGGSMQLPDHPGSAPGIAGESVVFRKGRPFRFGITIGNAGSFTVRVRGVPYPSWLPFSTRLLMSGPQKEPGMEQPWRPFHPFDLKPGEIRWLVLEGVYACHQAFYPLGPSATLTDFPVRFGFLWRTSTTEIRLPENLAIVFRKNSC